MTTALTDAERLLALLCEPCCPICTLSRQAALKYLKAQLLHQQGSPAADDAGRGVGGGVLCSRHWRKLVALEARHPRVPRLSEALLDKLLEAADGPRSCPACEVRQAAARRYLEALRRLPAETIGLALRQGEGFVCLKHLAALPAGPLKGWLLERVHALTLDLPRFQERYARQRGPEFGPEADPDLHGRALAALVGED
jgi:hypothetical protein